LHFHADIDDGGANFFAPTRFRTKTPAVKLDLKSGLVLPYHSEFADGLFVGFRIPDPMEMKSVLTVTMDEIRDEAVEPALFFPYTNEPAPALST